MPFFTFSNVIPLKNASISYIQYILDDYSNHQNKYIQILELGRGKPKLHKENGWKLKLSKKGEYWKYYFQGIDLFKFTLRVHTDEATYKTEACRCLRIVFVFLTISVRRTTIDKFFIKSYLNTYSYQSLCSSFVEFNSNYVSYKVINPLFKGSCFCLMFYLVFNSMYLKHLS